MVATQIPTTSDKFTPLQLELLRLFAHDPSEAELLDIKKILGQYYLQKLTSKADKFATEQNWTADDVEAMLNNAHQ